MTITTPLAPRVPQIAVAAPSFSIFTFSISTVARYSIGRGKPSTTINGLPPPRKYKSETSFHPSLCIAESPGNIPYIVLYGLGVEFFPISSAVITDTAAVSLSSNTVCADATAENINTIPNINIYFNFMFSFLFKFNYQPGFCTKP